MLQEPWPAATVSPRGSIREIFILLPG